jgi:hypothetical protein
MGNYIAAVILNIILLVVLNRLPDWNVRVLAPSYQDVLRVINLSLGVQVAGNFILIFFHPLYLHHLGQAVFSAFSAFAVWRVYRVFPFDLTGVIDAIGWFDTFLKIFIMVVFIATVIGGSISFYRFLRSVFFPPEEV